MRVLLSVSYGSSEAIKIVDLPQGISPQIGMVIHTHDDIDFKVIDIDVSIDKLDLSDDPAVILLLEPREGSYDSRPSGRDGELLFKYDCSILTNSGWDVPQSSTK